MFISFDRLFVHRTHFVDFQPLVDAVDVEKVRAGQRAHVLTGAHVAQAHAALSAYTRKGNTVYKRNRQRSNGRCTVAVQHSLWQTVQLALTCASLGVDALVQLQQHLVVVLVKLAVHHAQAERRGRAAVAKVAVAKRAVAKHRAAKPTAVQHCHRRSVDGVFFFVIGAYQRRENPLESCVVVLCTASVADRGLVGVDGGGAGGAAGVDDAALRGSAGSSLRAANAQPTVRLRVAQAAVRSCSTKKERCL